MKEFAEFLRMFPFGFWVGFVIVAVGEVTLRIFINESPEGEETADGFKTFEQLYNEAERQIKLLETANQSKYNEGYEDGLNELKLCPTLKINGAKIAVAPDESVKTAIDKGKQIKENFKKALGKIEIGVK